MIETIELRNPVTIDDVRVRELTYDVEKITSDQFIQAELLAADKAARSQKLSAKVPELDTAFHYYLGAMAILAVNPEYSIQDVERIKGPDMMKVVHIGRNFMTAGAEEEDEEGTGVIVELLDGDVEEPDEQEGYPETLD